MPSPLLPALITGGASLLGQGINAISQGAMNKKSREWQEKMYGIQRQDSLADWAMQNEYNHPSSQMARLRAAGLNPNLVYGHGADTTSGSVRSSDTGSWNPIAPKVDLQAVAQSAMGAYMSMELKEAQVDNFRSQNTVLTNEALLKLAQTEATLAGVKKTNVDVDMTKFDLAMKQQLQEITKSQAEANLANTRAQTKMTLDENERKAAMQAPTITKAVEEIYNLRLSRAKTRAEINHINQQISNLKQDARLKQFDEETQSKGIHRNSPTWWRMINAIVNNIPGGSIVDKALEKYDSANKRK